MPHLLIGRVIIIFNNAYDSKEGIEKASPLLKQNWLNLDQSSIPIRECLTLKKSSGIVRLQSEQNSGSLSIAGNRLDLSFGVLHESILSCHLLLT